MMNDKAMGRYDGAPISNEEEADWIVMGYGDPKEGYVIGLVEFGEVRGTWSAHTHGGATAIFDEKRMEQRVLGEMLREEERGFAYEKA